MCGKRCSQAEQTLPQIHPEISNSKFYSMQRTLVNRKIARTHRTHRPLRGRAAACTRVHVLLLAAALLRSHYCSIFLKFHAVSATGVSLLCCCSARSSFRIPALDRRSFVPTSMCVQHRSRFHCQMCAEKDRKMMEEYLK